MSSLPSPDRLKRPPLSGSTAPDPGSLDTLLRIEQLSVSYGQKHILRDITLTVNGGEVVAILGANGSGKSTLLKAIGGLLRPDGGIVVFRGKDMTGVTALKAHQAGIGYLMQDGGVFPSLTVAENLGIVYRAKHVDQPFAQWRTGVLGDYPMLAGLTEQRAGTLSGGERRLLAIAMIMAREPKLLLLDEPSAGLAPAASAWITEKVVASARIARQAIILVEQNVQLALRLADRSYVLREGLAQPFLCDRNSPPQEILEALLFTDTNIPNATGDKL